MDGFEFNKIAGAVLATALAVMGLGIIAEAIYAPVELEEPAYVIAVASAEDEVVDSDEAVGIDPIGVRLQVADVASGQSEAKKCQACHTFDQGGAAKVGPNLWDIVGRDIASAGGFGYSDAFQGAQDQVGDWSFDDLDAFLTEPKTWIKGTSMAFTGLKKPDKRANVIAYLRTLSDSPVELPAAADDEEAEAEVETEADSETAAQ